MASMNMVQMAEYVVFRSSTLIGAGRDGAVLRCTGHDGAGKREVGDPGVMSFHGHRVHGGVRCTFLLHYRRILSISNPSDSFPNIHILGK
jgi:hypothetical protein